MAAAVASPVPPPPAAAAAAAAAAVAAAAAAAAIAAAITAAITAAGCRAGYTPADYPTDAEWAARLLIESSDAAKCPTVAYQLAGEAAAGMMGEREGGKGGACKHSSFRFWMVHHAGPSSTCFAPVD